MRTTVGTDWLSRVMGGDASVGDSGTSTGVTATTLTDSGKSWGVNAWAGHIVFTGAVWGVVLSNTGTVLTIDRWNTPATPGGSAAGNPATGAYIIGPGSAPMWWMGLSTDGTAPAAGDTTLAAEQTTNGLSRALATYAHTPGQSTFTLSKTFTSTQGSGSTTLQKVGFFNAQNGGTLCYETALPAAATLMNGDTTTPTDTMTLS